MISSYQNAQNRQYLNNLAAYAETTDKNIVQLNDVIGSIYSKNLAFQEMDSYQSEAEKVGHIYTLLNLIKMQVEANQNLSGLFIYYDNSEHVLHNVNAAMKFADKETLKEKGRLIVAQIPATYVRFIESTENAVYYNVFIKKSSAAIGGNLLLSLGVPEDRKNTSAFGIIQEGTFYLTAGKTAEDIHYDPATLKPGRNHVDGAVIYLRELSTTDMAVVEILPQSLWLYVNGTHVGLALCILLFLLLSIKLYLFTSDLLTKPLEDMTNALLQIQSGIWEVNFTVPNRISEIESVRQAVSVMLNAIKQYKIHSYEERLDKQKIQLQFLQLQLAPHFYTNCMKNAYCMMKLKEYENVEGFLLFLSTHLRYLLQKDVTQVMVQTEREFVMNYVKLQNLMSSSPISCEITVDEEAREQFIPILTLQTFVENSIKYAHITEEESLKIRINVRYRHTERMDYLDITVKDNGRGYPKEVLHMLNRRVPSDEQNLGVGVVNLQKRIMIKFGTKASWYFDNTAGAFSELVLPVMQGHEDEYIDC